MSRISASAASAKSAAWNSLGSWNEADIERYDAVARRIDDAAKQAAVSSSEGFYATYTEGDVVGLSPDAVPSVRPDPRDPFTTLWRQLAQGEPFEEALLTGRSTLEGTMNKYVVNTSRMTGDAWSEVSGVSTLWRRVLTGVSCEWCALVSTQAYRSASSATFGHDNCDCLIVPTPDPGRSQNVRRRGVLDQGLADRLDTMGVQGRLAEQQASSRSLQAASNAERRRDDALSRLGQETDPTKRQLLESRARRWDREAQRFRARAAEQAARPRSTADGTGYVTPEGTPAPRP